MPNVKFVSHYTLSGTGQRAALLAGLPAQEKQSIEVSTDDPEIIAELAVLADGSAIRHLDNRWTGEYSSQHRRHDAPLTVDDVIALIRADAAAKRAHEEARQAERAAEQALSLAAREAILAGTAIARDGKFAYDDCVYVDFAGGKNIKVARTQQIEPWIARETECLQAEKNRTEAQAESERKAKQAAAERGKAVLRTWATEHGSERLRLMLDLGAGDWQEVARREYMDAHAPEGYVYGTRSGAARKKPTLAELQELRRLRSLVAESSGVLSDPTVDWVVEEGEYDDETGETTPERRYAVAELQVHSPDGEYDWYHREIES